MSQIPKKRPTTGRDAKRARFTNEKKPSGASPLVLIAGLAVVVALVGGTLFALSRTPAASARTAQGPAWATPWESAATSEGLPVQAATQGHSPYPLVRAENGTIRLPLSTFDDGQAHFYTYLDAGRPIEFFVLKSQDGGVRAAFNACDVCYSARLGYRQEGDEMVCNNCGNRFPADQINVLRGGCNPSPLERSVEGDTLVIRVSDVTGGLFFFQG